MRQGGNDPTSLGQTAKAKIEEIFAFEKLGTTCILQCKFGCQNSPYAPNVIMSTEVCHYRLFKGHTDCGSEQAVELQPLCRYLLLAVETPPLPCRSTEQSAAIQWDSGGRGYSLVLHSWFNLANMFFSLCQSEERSNRAGDYCTGNRLRFLF